MTDIDTNFDTNSVNEEGTNQSNGLIDSAGQINQDILAGTMIVAGLFVTFFGARFFKQIVFFVGFCCGGFLTYYSVPIIWSWFDAEVKDDTLLYISLTVGALCGVILVVVYKAAVFSCGAICGAIFSQILWIAVVANVDTEGKDWMAGVQIGVLIAFALLGGWLAFKFVEQVLKAITAFVGGFMFASGTAFFISRIDKSDQRNVIDWVVFFGSYSNYSNLEDVCDVYCIVCILLWLVLFACGCFVQYKLHKKHKRKDNDDGYDTDSDDEDSESRRKKKKRKGTESDYDSDSDSEPSRRSKKRKKKREADNHYAEPPRSDYGGYAGSEYGGSHYGAGSMRQSGRYARSLHSNSIHDEGNYGGGAVAMSAPQYAQSAYNPDYNRHNMQAPGAAHSEAYVGSYGQRGAVQFV